MATKRATIRVILEVQSDTDEPADCVFDSADLPVAMSILSGFTSWRREELLLGASAADQALTFTDAIAILLVSDTAFDYRHVAAEALQENLRMYLAWADDTADGIHQVSMLLSGNGVTPSQITAYIFEKP